MKTSIYAMAVKTYVPMLRSLSHVLDQGAEHARAKKSDAADLVNARLAPDMYPLAQQVQLACDQAGDSTARLSGQDAPQFENDEKTLEDLKVRIDQTLKYVENVRPDAFDGAEDRPITIPIPENNIDFRPITIPIPENNIDFEMNGLQYLRDWALPHFYFHLVTAYGILRHQGVDIGKRDYMNQVAKYIRQRNPA
jgi:hypothetical protein